MEKITSIPRDFVLWLEAKDGQRSRTPKFTTFPLMESFCMYAMAELGSTIERIDVHRKEQRICSYTMINGKPQRTFTHKNLQKALDAEAKADER